MTYFISDTHFGHAATIEFSRPFADVEEMDSTIMENWNSIVQPTDTVYIVGDFWYKGWRNGRWYLQQLPGHKSLIPGNHDYYWLHKLKEAVELVEVAAPLVEVWCERGSCVLCHDPMLEWHGDRRGTPLVYRHTHGSDFMSRKGRLSEIMKNMPHALNACVDINSYSPVTLEQLRANNATYFRRARV